MSIVYSGWRTYLFVPFIVMLLYYSVDYFYIQKQNVHNLCFGQFLYTGHSIVSIIPASSEYIVKRHGNTSEHSVQEDLFESLLLRMYEMQRNISKTNRVIIYKVNSESGLGNVIIGLVSSVIAAIATGRGFQIKQYPIYHTNFHLTFPSMDYQHTIIPPSQVEYFFMYATLRQGRDLRRQHLNKLTHKASLEIDCFTNTTSNFLSNRAYNEVWKQTHLLSNNTTTLQGVVNLLYEMMMYPQEPLCTIIHHYLSLLLRRYMIGVQVRIGGDTIRYKDKQFLTISDLPLFYKIIDRVLVNRSLTHSDVYIFVSTDNETIITEFRRKYGNSVIVADEFSIGHSSPAKNRIGSSKVMLHAQRAIVDLLVLQRADLLLVTEESSFGSLAVALQSNRHSSVNTTEYVELGRHVKCNVFERSDRSLEAVIVSSNRTDM